MDATYTHLGVGDNELYALQASIAPNPATEEATVSFHNPKAGRVTFEVFSLQGQRMLAETEVLGEGEQNHELSLGGLAKGFYILRIESEERSMATIKLLKQ